MNAPVQKGVVLPAGHTGSSLFHLVLREAAERFPDALGPARLPTDARRFKRTYRDALVRFEARRAASPQRVEIARFIVQRTQAALHHTEDGRTSPLLEHLQGKPAPVELQTRALNGEPGFVAEVPWDGKLYRRRELLGLSERLATEGILTDAARSALRWIVEHLEERGGRLDLRSERFALLGAGAELAPARMLLAAGARVLWIDLTSPEQALGAELRTLAGSLSQLAGANNLLQAPRAVVEAIERFADDSAVHLGLFAYASGASREWRLAATMNAIAGGLQPERVRSVSMLVSPTTAAPVQPESARQAEARGRSAAPWQQLLRGMRVLVPGGHDALGETRVARAAVSIQGLSYQAAQYVSKLATAETFAVYGLRGDAERPRPVTVSANVAGITATRSLQHPLFQAAFLGAPRFGVRIFDPVTTRALSGLLILHDLLNPDAPGASSGRAVAPGDKAQRLLSQQVHGGVYSLPYELESAIRVAALIGLASKPSLLLARAPREPRLDAAAASGEPAAAE